MIPPPEEHRRTGAQDDAANEGNRESLVPQEEEGSNGTAQHSEAAEIDSGSAAGANSFAGVASVDVDRSFNRPSLSQDEELASIEASSGSEVSERRPSAPWTRAGAFTVSGSNQRRVAERNQHSVRRRGTTQDAGDTVALPAVLVEDSVPWVMQTLVWQRAPIVDDANVRVIARSAISQSQREAKNSWSRCFYLRCALAISAVSAVTGVTFGVVFALGRSKQEKKSLAGTGSNATYDKFHTIRDIVSSVSHEHLLSDPNSPQFKALSWIAQVDEFDLSLLDEDRLAIIQRYIMALLYFSTGGETWAGKKQSDLNALDCMFWGGKICFWPSFNGIKMERSGPTTYLSPTSHECSWEGVGCSEGSHNVAAIYLAENNLTGTIPSEVSVLDLQVLYLSTNKLAGTIPQSVFNMPSLRTLDLFANRLSGTISSDVSTTLEWISLSHNFLTGTIPSGIGTLANISFLLLLANQFTGTLPFDYEKMASLRMLDVAYNGLTGSIPSAIDKMTKPMWFAVDRNSLTGTIPESIGNMTSIEVLGLSGNQFTGRIPPSIFGLKDLRVLLLSENTFTGTLPLVRQEKSSLQIAAFDHNFLSGSIPQHMGWFPELMCLTLNSNEITGIIPEELASLAKLTYLWLNDNNLHGTLPDAFSNASNLVGLTLHKNALEGDMEFMCNQNVSLLSLPQRDEEHAENCSCCTSCAKNYGIGDMCDPRAHYEFIVSVSVLAAIVRSIFLSI